MLIYGYSRLQEKNEVLSVLGEVEIVQLLNFNYVCVWLLFTCSENSILLSTQYFLLCPELPNIFLVQLFCVTMSQRQYLLTILQPLKSDFNISKESLARKIKDKSSVFLTGVFFKGAENSGGNALGGVIS